jgi:hypothetical protein
MRYWHRFVENLEGRDNMRNPSERRKNKKAVKYIDLDWIKVASD